MTGDIEVVNETVSMRMLLGWVVGLDKIKIQQSSWVRCVEVMNLIESQNCETCASVAVA